MERIAAVAADRQWWKPRKVPQGHTLHCTMGPLCLQLHHDRREWRLAWSYGEETEAECAVELDLRQGPLEAGEFERYAFSRQSDTITLLPMLADRSVVVRPRQSVFLPSGEETTLYLSSPLHLSLQVGAPVATLRELPMVVLSDTWFGPNTLSGELCYSGKTGARQALSDVPRRAHRALTAVHIRNDASTPLPLDKFSLPVPLLSVYGDSDGGLWTQGVSLVRTGHSDMAAVKIDKVPPRAGGNMELLSGPRRVQERGALVRAFDVLFGD
jgi:hypothetical protein